MKTTKVILSVVSILVVLDLTVSYPEEKKGYVPKDDEEIYGTWVNTDGWHQKRTIYPDGKIEVFRKESDTQPWSEGSFTIIDKWTDSEGNIWYKTQAKVLGLPLHYFLHRISNSGKTREYIWSDSDYPAEIDPNHSRYYIYYRK